MKLCSIAIFQYPLLSENVSICDKKKSLYGKGARISLIQFSFCKYSCVIKLAVYVDYCFLYTKEVGDVYRLYYVFCVYYVHCVVYCVLCSVLCTVYCVVYFLVNCVVYCALCTLYTLCTVYCTLYYLLCTVYCVLCRPLLALGNDRFDCEGDGASAPGTLDSGK